MIDLYLRFNDQPEAISILQPLGMTYTDEEIARDANGDIIYTTKQEAVYGLKLVDDGDGEPEMVNSALFDDAGNPVMEDVQVPLMVPVEKISQGSHQYAAWVVGSIDGVSGYHLNVRQVDPELDLTLLAEYEVKPLEPRCVWA